MIYNFLSEINSKYKECKDTCKQDITLYINLSMLIFL